MIQIAINDLKREVDVMQRLTAHFVTAESEPAFTALAQSIEFLRPLAAGSRQTISILREKPIRTIDSVGQYELAPRTGSDTIYAEVSGTWDLETIGRPKLPGRLVEFSGIASTQIAVWRRNADGSTQEVAMWRFEIGDRVSPGCHFHTQILGAKPDLPFPKSISIPRLPNYFLTAMSGLDFALGELFQDTWIASSCKASPNLSLWNGIQKPRITKLLGWQIEEMRNNHTSPWVVLKKAKPSATLFL